jgi:lipopolysaccharide transport system ATP-binding protein
MGAIEKLCEKGILLENGRLRSSADNISDIINRYRSSMREASLPSHWINDGLQYQSCEVVPIEFSIQYSGSKEVPYPWKNDKEFIGQAKIDVKYLDESMNIGVAIYDASGDLLLWSFNTDDPESSKLTTGINIINFTIPGRLFNEGDYHVEFLASFHMRKFIIKPGEGPVVNLSISGGLSESFYWQSARPGKLAPVWKWSIS